MVGKESVLLDATRHISLIILDALRDTPWNVRPMRLAQILRGEQVQEMAWFDYDMNLYYGRLSHLTRAEITSLIEQLIHLGYLKKIHGIYPVLYLSARGEAALENREAIPLHLSTISKNGRAKAPGSDTCSRN